MSYFSIMTLARCRFTNIKFPIFIVLLFFLLIFTSLYRPKTSAKLQQNLDLDLSIMRVLKNPQLNLEMKIQKTQDTIFPQFDVPNLKLEKEDRLFDRVAVLTFLNAGQHVFNVEPPSWFTFTSMMHSSWKHVLTHYKWATDPSRDHFRENCLFQPKSNSKNFILEPFSITAFNFISPRLICTSQQAKATSLIEVFLFLKCGKQKNSMINY